jgi:hypothetical protein
MNLDDIKNQKAVEDENKKEEENKKTEEQKKEDEKKKTDNTEKEKILKENKTLYIPILKDNSVKINNIKIDKEIPTVAKYGAKELVGYIELEKVSKSEDENKFKAKIFARKAFNYKNEFDIVKAIFEADEKTTPSAEPISDKFIDITGDNPATLGVAFNQESGGFSLEQKGGFLGLNKKIESRGKIDPSFKNYVNNIRS